MAEGLSPGDLATLSLLDPEQGVCPNGHPCTFDRKPGYRRCQGCDYRGFALICWEITPAAIDVADAAGASPAVVSEARQFLGSR